jgi:uncharacterized MnhB-related membrane protein
MIKFNTELLENEKFKTFLAVLGAVAMYFTPDPYDAVITALLSAFGVGNLVISKK